MAYAVNDVTLMLEPTTSALYKKYHINLYHVERYIRNVVDQIRIIIYLYNLNNIQNWIGLKVIL